MRAFSLFLVLLAACGESSRLPSRDAGDGNPDAAVDLGPPDLGMDFRRPPVCGDGLRGEGETCDDGNDVAGDGCSAVCLTEPGWRCPAPGLPCGPEECGDGIRAGTETLGEECDDGGTAPGDGCSSECTAEDGWVCDDAGCRRTVCGDGTVEGSESCDDGNDDPFDACARCQVVPSCPAGPCVAVCGDALLFPGEACDDGNLEDGDGCSATCTLEEGFACVDVTEASGGGDVTAETIEVSVVFRDFISRAVDPASTLTHPDFADTVGSQGISRDMVAASLGPGGLPVYTGNCERGREDPLDCRGDGRGNWQTHSEALFDQWYGGGPLASEVSQVLTLTEVPGRPDVFRFGASGGFFPLDGLGWVGAGIERADCSPPHNFYFTTEVRAWFTFEGGEELTFAGDDDVWVFIGGRLALDLGGVHGSETATVRLEADGTAVCTGECVEARRDLGLVRGQLYEVALFHAERRGCGSNFQLDLAGFDRVRTLCEEVCGDGILTRGEQCDDGNDDNDDACANDCTFNLI
ncbi:MAG: DUF4215 domain-containing protein [Myxococcota bacterium]